MKQTNHVTNDILDILRAKSPDLRIAVVGASSNPQKYGNIIVRNLRSKGYNVLPVNPKESEIEGLPAFASVNDIRPSPTIVNFVVPPAVTQSVLETIKDSGIETVWFQDGSYDDATVAYAHAHFKNVVHDACIMVATSAL